MNWFWLSFADGSLPKGSQFLGACIVGQASNFGGAVLLAHSLGCNPGGQVVGFPILPEVEPKIPASYRERLLTRAEAEELDRIVRGVDVGEVVKLT